MTAWFKHVRLALSMVVFVAAISSVIAGLAMQSAQGSQSIVGPDQWVPFQGKFRSVNGGADTHGTIYRASNGSERRDAYVPSIGSSTISILNIPKQALYTLIISNAPGSSPQWEMRPLVLPRAGYRPRRQMSRQSRTLRGTASVQIAGRSAWETSRTAADGSDARLFLALDLNFFPVRTESSDRQEEFFDIAVGEPDPKLFDLPPGAQIGRTGPAVRLGRFTPRELGLIQ